MVNYNYELFIKNIVMIYIAIKHKSLARFT